VFGYRINPFTDRVYDIRRKLLKRLVSAGVPTSRVRDRTLTRT